MWPDGEHCRIQNRPIGAGDRWHDVSGMWGTIQNLKPLLPDFLIDRRSAMRAVPFKVEGKQNHDLLRRDLRSEAEFLERSYGQGKALKTVGDGAGIVGDVQTGERAG